MPWTLVLIIVTPLILACINYIGTLVQGVWLSTLLASIRNWEYALVGSNVISSLLLWIIIVCLFIGFLHLASFWSRKL